MLAPAFGLRWENCIVHEVSRRSVLGTGVAAIGLAVTGVPSSAAAAAPARLPRRSHYARFVGRQFLAVNGAERRRLRLVSITNLQRTTAAQQQDCFSLIFVPVNGRKLADGIYRLHRSGAHTSELFLSGVDGGIKVQALVNRATAR